MLGIVSITFVLPKSPKLILKAALLLSPFYRWKCHKPQLISDRDKTGRQMSVVPTLTLLSSCLFAVTGFRLLLAHPNDWGGYYLRKHSYSIVTMGIFFILEIKSIVPWFLPIISQWVALLCLPQRRLSKTWGHNFTSIELLWGVSHYFWLFSSGNW